MSIHFPSYLYFSNGETRFSCLKEKWRWHVLRCKFSVDNDVDMKLRVFTLDGGALYMGVAAIFLG
jgi:hypothetical protein